MRILYYNWVPLFDALKRGGGVRIYQEGLIQQALAEGHDVTYFSAGVRYNLLRAGLRALGSVRSHPHGKLREFEIVNSPVLAPSYHQFGRRLTEVESEEYRSFLIDFINKNGPFDVFHLNNAEGIPFSLFRDRSQLNVGRVVVSLHNYHLLCQQVNLWHAEKIACTDYEQGHRCTRCVTPPSSFEVLAASTFHDMIGGMVTEGSRTHGFLFRLYSRAKGAARRALRLKRRLARAAGSPAKTPVQALVADGGALFRSHRHEAVAMLNVGVDVAVPVSRRVGEIFEAAGVSPDQLKVEYIATNFASTFSPLAAQERALRRLDEFPGRLNIAFLGYARRDKGFFFLLEALAALPKHAKGKISVTLAARGADQHADLIDVALSGFAARHVIDGYTHGELKSLLDDIDLGIVPVMWEDCLPQVAYEFVGNGVPILAANMGGAPELVGPPELVFKAGDLADFSQRLASILESPEALQKFWENTHIPMLDWHAHWARLMDIYDPETPLGVESKSESRESLV